ncbi:MAG: ELWxxDGT repeat protein, partial [Archangium sp.]
MAGGCGAPSSEPLDATTSPRTSQSLDGQTAPPGACQPVGLVKDIAPGAANAIPDYDIQPPAALGRTFFFAANDGTTGLELWKSNGSKDGTVLVKDVFPGSENSDPRFLTGVGGTLFFIAADGAHGRELWKTDGTPEGTVLVKDIRPGTEGSGATGLTAVGGTLFFIADDGVHGPELWKSDGTEAGTVLVKDVLPGAAGSGLSDLVVFKGALYFAADGGPHEAELWKSDGTDAGTERVAVIRVIESDPGEQILRGLTAAGDKLYFFAGSS